MIESAPALDDQGLPVGYRLQPQWEVTPRQLKAMRDRGDGFVLIDCRLPKEHALARIEGARLLPLQELDVRWREIEALGEKPLVIHCHHGGRSLKMAMLLAQHGLRDVKSLAGGIDLWSLDIDPSVPRY
jgi:rhodanese-related sulfurtransferase